MLFGSSFVDGPCLSFLCLFPLLRIFIVVLEGVLGHNPFQDQVSRVGIALRRLRQDSLVAASRHPGDSEATIRLIRGCPNDVNAVSGAAPCRLTLQIWIPSSVLISTLLML